jgi:hypothetical protein
MNGNFAVSDDAVDGGEMAGVKLPANIMGNGDIHHQGDGGPDQGENGQKDILHGRNLGG